MQVSNRKIGLRFIRVRAKRRVGRTSTLIRAEQGEKTLLIIKPDAVMRNLIGEILHRVEVSQFKIKAMKMVFLNEEDARKFYAVHQKKPFYEPLVRYMSSGPSLVALLERENAVNALRELVGKTNPKEASLGTIRRDYGLDKRRNSVHASDSPQTATQEIAFFFDKSDYADS
ncbi:MAG: nucleoside-diphosphate kinase [Candidatus Edwardsbacteria bacterium]